ncbi:MAG: hypothetical protein GC139_09730 [Sideroxydans sp.]|nr:hypothetical protein [Sideroxydans sp.]
MMETPVEQVEIHSALIFLGVAGAIGLLAGAILIIRPHWLKRLGEYANRWISTRKFESVLDRIFNIEKWFYQHHRISGSLMLAAACWIVIYFVGYFDKNHFVAMLPGNIRAPRELLEGFLDGAVLIFLAGAVFAAIIGLFLLLRPSLLREFEHGANQWISTRRALEVLERPHNTLDQYVARNVRLFGLLLLLGSLYIIGALVFWLG